MQDGLLLIPDPGNCFGICFFGGLELYPAGSTYAAQYFVFLVVPPCLIMDEFEHFKQFILTRVSMSPEELTGLASAFTLKKVKKKQFIIQPDFVVKHRNFVSK